MGSGEDKGYFLKIQNNMDNTPEIMMQVVSGK
jgi:hypothetical protein